MNEWKKIRCRCRGLAHECNGGLLRKAPNGDAIYLWFKNDEGGYMCEIRPKKQNRFGFTTMVFGVALALSLSCGKHSSSTNSSSSASGTDNSTSVTNADGSVTTTVSSGGSCSKYTTYTGLHECDPQLAYTSCKTYSCVMVDLHDFTLKCCSN